MNFRCFECGGPAEHAHHVVPASKGGTRTVPLCTCCHGKAHHFTFSSQHRNLIKEGIAKARAAGVKIGRRPVTVPLGAVKELHDRGLSLRAIGRQLKIGAATAHKILNSGTVGAV